jgi:chromosome segregation ATPase
MNRINHLVLGLVVIIIFSSLVVVPQRTSAENTITLTTYNPSIAQKLTSRCDLVKDYLAQTARINELAARQNKVRGWEYVLRRLGESKSKYSKFGVDYKELDGSLQSLNQQLEQFKVDFETYDAAFQRLQSMDCVKQPETFWNQLETLRSFRNGVALAADNFKTSLSQVLAREEAKW